MVLGADGFFVVADELLTRQDYPKVMAAVLSLASAAVGLYSGSRVVDRAPNSKGFTRWRLYVRWLHSSSNEQRDTSTDSDIRLALW